MPLKIIVIYNMSHNINKHKWEVYNDKEYQDI
jgi:hypothetical protein